MRKRILICMLVLTIILSLTSCKEKTTSDSPSETIEATVTEEPIEVTPELTQAPTPTAAPTPDDDPLGKINLSPENMNELIHYWSISSVDVEQQGKLDELTISINGTYLDMNYFFSDSRSEDEIKNLYTDVISGEWEKDEYSAGPLLEGNAEDGDKVLCQLIDEGSINELSVFISRDSAEDAEKFTNFFNIKWPVGVIPYSDMMSDKDISSLSVHIIPTEMNVIYSKGFLSNGNETKIIEYYKEALASYDNFQITTDYNDNEVVECSSNGIDIKVYYEEFWQTIKIEYTVQMQQQ